jgi:hypothetical protein
MSSTFGGFNFEVFRASLANMSDEELIRYARTVRENGLPFARFGKPSGLNEEATLEECRAEWRRRKRQQ